MIKEIVPLSEVLATVVLHTLKNFDLPFALGVQVGVNFIVLGIGNVLLYLDRLQVK